MNQELPDVQARFRKGRGTRDHIANIRWIIEKATEFQKKSTSASLTMLKSLCQFSSVQSLSRVRLFGTPWIAARQASLSITNSQNSLKLTSIESVMPSSHLFLCRPLLLPPVPPSISLFQRVSFSILCVDHNKLWKILQEMGTLDHLTCLQRNLYAGQEATVGTGHGTTDWFQIGKGVHQDCILSPCLFYLNAEYILQNAWLHESQAGIKIGGRNINNLRYTESEEKLKSLLRVKEESEKVGLKLNIQKTKIMTSSSII